MAIRIEGAGEHNLKDVDVEIGDGLTVVTGVSGSGKTSLVFDDIVPLNCPVGLLRHLTLVIPQN